MSQEQDGRKIPSGVLLLSKEELELKRRVDASYFFFNFVPVCIFSNITLGHFIKNGTLKAKRPGVVYATATLVSYVFSKYLAYRELHRQLMINFPDGTYAQTRNMSREQTLEYVNKQQLEFAKKRLESAGMRVVEDPVAQSRSTSDPGLEPSSYSSKTSDYNQDTSPKPVGKTTSELFGDEKLADPPSKLRPVRKNKYGDEIE